MKHESNSNHQSINNIKQIDMEHDEQTFNNAYGRPLLGTMLPHPFMKNAFFNSLEFVCVNVEANSLYMQCIRK